MNVQTITMLRQQAQQAFREYREAFRKYGEKRDRALMHGYKALAKGKQVIDLAEVMKAAGIDANRRPLLAVGRADATEIWLRRSSDGSAAFWMDRWPTWRATRRCVSLPPGTFTWNHQSPASLSEARATVPLIPARYRPANVLSNYHLLWEADWEDVPRDPMLLRRLDGMLFAVLAVWDLTELERAVLRR